MTDRPGPTVALIGGVCRLESGAEIDTRTSIDGDPWDVFLREVLNRSALWWETARRLTDSILAEIDDEAAWVMTWSEKTARHVSADGTVKNRRMKALLGDVVSLMDDPYQSNKKLAADKATTRYRIVPYYYRFADIISRQAPSVFLGGFHTTYEDGSDIVGLSPLDYVADRWSNTIFVLPHTPLIQRKVEDLAVWHRQGRKTRSPLFSWESSDPVSAERTNPRLSERFVKESQKALASVAGKPVAADADFGITYFLDRGQMRNPNDLNAALQFVESRYDLDIGLWDLARDPVLRDTLARPKDADVVLSRPTTLPQLAKADAADAIDERERKKTLEREARDRVHAAIWPHLGRAGQWRVTRSGQLYELPVGRRRNAPRTEYESAWLGFRIEVLKRETRLRVNTASAGYSTKIARLLSDQNAQVRELTGADIKVGEVTIDLFVQKGQGWGSDEYDGSQISTLASRVIDALQPIWGHLEVLAEKSFQSYQRDAESSLVIVEATIPGQRAKPGLLSRLFGKGR